LHSIILTHPETSRYRPWSQNSTQQAEGDRNGYQVVAMAGKSRNSDFFDKKKLIFVMVTA
jgi:hypothetical protein